MIQDTLLPNLTATGREPRMRRRAPSGIYRRLIIGGWTAPEAGNLVAHLNGIAPVNGGWSVQEIDHLLFLRRLAESGRVKS